MEPNCPDRVQDRDSKIVADAEADGGVVLPLYLYDHGVVSISTSSFVGRAHHADWDSGQVGYVYIEGPDIVKEWDGDKEKAVKYLQAAVKEWDYVYRGEVYGFSVFRADGEVEDSCGGFIGDLALVEEQARFAAESARRRLMGAKIPEPGEVYEEIAQIMMSGHTAIGDRLSAVYDHLDAYYALLKSVGVIAEGETA